MALAHPVSKFSHRSLIAGDMGGAECLTDADVGDTVMSDCQGIVEDDCRQTDSEESAGLLVSSNTGSLLQHQARHTVTSDTNAASQLLAVSGAMSGEVCRPTGAQTSGSDGNQLVPLELYIQGNSQTVFLLFLQQGSLSELDVVKDLVGICCSLGAYCTRIFGHT